MRLREQTPHNFSCTDTKFAHEPRFPLGCVILKKKKTGDEIEEREKELMDDGKCSIPFTPVAVFYMDGVSLRPLDWGGSLMSTALSGPRCIFQDHMSSLEVSDTFSRSFP